MLLRGQKNAAKEKQMQLLNIQEAARELGIAPVSVRRKVHSGELPHRRLGALIRFTPQDLQSYLESCAVPARRPVKGAAHE
jgi:excisionase family DNA binding protein